MSLRDEIFAVCAKTMGPAAGPFLDRQCKLRLNKAAEQLAMGDLDTLAKWVQIGASLTLGDDVGKRLAGEVLKLRR